MDLLFYFQYTQDKEKTNKNAQAGFEQQTLGAESGDGDHYTMPLPPRRIMVGLWNFVVVFLFDSLNTFLMLAPHQDAPFTIY